MLITQATPGSSNQNVDITKELLRQDVALKLRIFVSINNRPCINHEIILGFFLQSGCCCSRFITLSESFNKQSSAFIRCGTLSKKAK